MVPSPQKRRKQSGPVAITNIYSLPDELLLTIIKIAAEDGSTNAETEERDDDYGRSWFAAMPHLREHTHMTSVLGRGGDPIRAEKVTEFE